MTATKIRVHETYSDIVHLLQWDGYSFSVRGNQIDAEVVRESSCAECGSSRTRYEAWRRESPRGYAAVMVCRDCGYAQQF